MNALSIKKALVRTGMLAGYYLLAGLVAMIAGDMSGSAGLAGFGFYSLIGVFSGVVTLWMLIVEQGDIPAEIKTQVARRAAKIVCIGLLALAAYLAFISIKKFEARSPIKPSLLGIAVAALSAGILPLLTQRKNRLAGNGLSPSLKPNPTETVLCALVPGVLLCGLLLGYFIGLWWADAASGFAMAAIILLHGAMAFKEQESLSGKKWNA